MSTQYQKLSCGDDDVEVQDLSSPGGDEDEEETVKWRAFKAYFNLSNSIMGVGILPVAYAFSVTGLFLGILFIIGVAIANDCTSYLIYRSRKAEGSFCYEELCKLSLGKLGQVVMQISMVILLLGTITGASVIISELLYIFLTYVGADAYVSGNVALVLYTGGLLFPLCLLRKVEYLEYSSCLGSVLVGMVMVFVVVQCAGAGFPTASTPDWLYPANRVDWLLAFPIFGFSFFLQPVVPSIMDSLGKVEQRRFPMVLHSSLLTAVVVYAVIGVFGFLQFRNPEGNILKMYTISNFFDAFLVLATLLYATVCYPLMHFPLRLACDSVFFGNATHMPSWRHVAWTVLLIGTATTVAIVDPDIVSIFSITGATGVCMISYVFPVLITMYSTESRGGLGAGWSGRKLFSIVVLVIGCIISFVSLLVLLLPRSVFEDIL